MGAVFSVRECYTPLLGSSQRANELAGLRSRGNPNRGVSTMVTVFSVRWSVSRLYNATPLVDNLGINLVVYPVPGGITGPPCSWGI
jgi:hypothetical protein